MSKQDRVDGMREKVDKELHYGIRAYLAHRTKNDYKDSIILKEMSNDWQGYAERVNNTQNLIVVDKMDFEKKLRLELNRLQNLITQQL